MSEVYDGEERRKCPGCETVAKLDRRVTKCKADFDLELATVKEAVAHLGSEVHGLRTDVHAMTASIGSINTSLETIARTLTQLADLPEAWTALKGFWSVMRFLRENIVVIAAMGGIIWYAVEHLA